MSTDNKATKRQVIRGWLRIVGPAFVVVGMILLAVSSIDFFSGRQSVSVQFGSESKAARTTDPPKYRWATYAGVPFVLIGIVMTSMVFDRLFAAPKDKAEEEDAGPRRTMDQPLGQWAAQKNKRGTDKGKRKA